MPIAAGGSVSSLIVWNSSKQSQWEFLAGTFLEFQDSEDDYARDAASMRLHSAVNIGAAGGRLIGSLPDILAVLGRGSGPRGEKMAGGRFSHPGDNSGPMSDHFCRFRARRPL